MFSELLCNDRFDFCYSGKSFLNENFFTRILHVVQNFLEIGL